MLIERSRNLLFPSVYTTTTFYYEKHFFNKVEVPFIILLRKENYVFSINNFNSVQLHIGAKVNNLQTTIA